MGSTAAGCSSRFPLMVSGLRRVCPLASRAGVNLGALMNVQSQWRSSEGSGLLEIWSSIFLLFS